MKEIIIIDKDKVIAFKPKGLDIYSQEYIEEIDIIENTKKVEQVPETFDELKELCKELCNKKSYDICCPYNSSICITKGKLDIDLVKEDFKIYVNNYCIAEHKTPQQMWNIIKSFIEE